MTICRHCGEEFFWTPTSEGKRPLNRGDGKPHWQSCREFRAGGKRHRNLKNGSSRKASKPTQATKPVTFTGEHFRETCKSCPIPPWLECCHACASVEDPKRHRRLIEAVDAINDEADERLQRILELAEQA